MAAPNATTTLHVIAVPYPGRGHVNPMLILSRLLAARLPPPAVVTVVLTEEWLSLVGGPAAAPPGVRFHTLPNVIPSENGRAADIVKFMEAVYTKLEEPFEKLLDELDTPATAIVADTYLPWVVDVGKRRGVPVCSLYTMSASFFSALLNYDRLPGETELAKAEGELLSKYIPGHGSIRLSDLSSFQCLHKPLELALQAVSKSTEAQCLLFTSAYELEPHIISSLRSQLSSQVLPIGPIIPYLTLQQTNLKTPSHDDDDDDDCLTFLNSQPQSSVLYVSLGSFLPVSRSQMDEIAFGLQESNVKFLWVARDESSRLREMIVGGGGDSNGMVVTWCDQLKVLCHPSIGGFLTHCGWNSTMEGIFAGVPMLIFPIVVDQPPNGRLVVDEWEAGVWLREDAKSVEVVGRKKVAELVKRVMDLEGDESREMRKRVVMLREACRSAVEEGGSSTVNLNDFVEFLIHAKEDTAKIF
ncbi:UDP-glycosyltransferase 87A1 [Dendrobium catenatum]|uniref:Glycosyltransferase n=2 Tax=Dendrobium TaxID=37818 RepID=A0A7T0FXP7_DENNO|nr:UDP-glycosyltransferase 87A1 [Dendrobium catenatum]PKU77367.1 UDP-glycosyltransferase 87A2 [Dendrobium catenatum]QPJ58192.1 UDP-glycosyltransferase 87a1 [Dendrobium nobile]